MTPGIKFHRGVKKLTLDRHIIDDSVDFPDDFRFEKAKDEQRFFKTFIDDVTRFDEKVAETTGRIYEAATSEIATWIVKNPGEGRRRRVLSVFSPDESIGNLRTALVQCNFTDISRLIQDFRKKMLEFDDDGKVIREMVVTENDAIHEIIDKVSELNSDPSTIRIIMIRQFESLRPHFLDSLISLLYSTSTCRSVISRVRLMICVSTSPAFFTQNIQMETMNMLELKNFKFTQLEEIFGEVICTGIHAFFKPPRPKPRNIQEDDPKLLMSYDCAPALFSGPFMKYLKDRFLACDYSVSALIRAVQFALLQKYLEDPLWREETHSEEMKKYDAVLHLFKDEFGDGTRVEFIQFHMKIQTDPDFLRKIREEQVFREKKQFLFEGQSKTNLLAFCDRILKRIKDFDTEFCEKLIELKEKLEAAKVERPVEIEESQTEKTPSKSQKMSFLDLQKQRKQAMSAKQKNNPISSAKSEIFAHIMSLFESTLRQYPATWRNVIGTWKQRDGDVKVSMDSSDEYDIENCLLNRNTEEPVSVAWRALLCQRNFKMVPISEWARTYLDNIKMSKKQAKGAFFAAAGQLEHIGLIRGAADKKSTNIHVLYHPISFIPSL
ncbi:hypothetical protein GCK72_011062 [Caenorhabditis remanei]|uniref:Uncharacterized protein n=1 Tax=Caenorhabditis remanei TaxID=31234 RepID=A0A6A5H6W8_CAERE|nr:hypothetical protein GCK72_011062 [Caenorhabditis remanei]KAF1762799.1 hypothetical protein GCK72_011062 [Caenorhabditis remanei]